MRGFLKKMNNRLDVGRYGKIAVLLLVIVLSSLFIVLKTDIAVADPGGGSGQGGGSSSGAASCSSNALYTPCPLVGYYDGYGRFQVDWNQSGVYGGGASWRLFRAVDNVWGLDDSAAYGTNPYNNILIGRYKQKAIDKCKSYGWIVSYGWDGIRNSVAGYGDFDFQIGPASRVINGVSQAINDVGVYYNSHDAATSGYSNNTRISLGYAVELYKKYLEDSGKSSAGVTDIPSDIGYFCSSSEDTRKSFQGRASISEGAWESSTNSATTNWTIKDNKTANISMKSPDGGVSTRVFLKLRRKTGSGKTYYRTKTNNGSWSSQKSITPAEDNGTHILKNGTQAGIWHTVKPGATYCRYLKFRPYGSLSDTATRTIGACAKAEVTTFTGSTSVSGAVTGGTGEGADNVTKNLTVNCPASSGCKIKFSHTINSSKNKGSTTYYITRTSTLPSQVSAGSVLGSTKLTATLNGATKTHNSGDLTLVPGMKVCEKIVFNKDNNSTTETGNATREVCVFATGNARDYGDEAYLNIKVRNNDVDRYKDYQGSVYAKPNDKVEFKASYNPKLQYAYDIVPDIMKIDGTASVNSNSNSSKLGALFDSKRASGEKWNNGFSVKSENFKSGSFGEVYLQGAGVQTQLNPDANSHTISNDEVGSELGERAKTNEDIAGKRTVKTTPSQVVFSESGGKVVADVKTTSIESVAKVKVPYNFKTGIDIELEGDTTVNDMPAFAAGESGKVGGNIVLKPKANSLTANNGDEYATKSDAKIRLVLFVPNNSTNLNGEEHYTMSGSLCDRYNSEQCYTMDSENETKETINKQGITVAQAKELKEKGIAGVSYPLSESFNVPDYAAGTKVCIAAAVYPSTSGRDDNISSDGDGTWNVSKAKCFVVYKKPSVQVWGGSVFSAGMLKTPVAEKNNVAGFGDYRYSIRSKNNSKSVIFGSFGELSVTSVGVVDGFSSGAATGYGKNNGNGTLTPSVGGDSSGLQAPFGGYTGGSSFCERSRLTFANTNSRDGLNCKFSAPGLNGSNGASVNNDRTSLVSTFINMSEEEAGSKDVVVKRTTGDYKISDDGDAFSFVEKGRTKVIYAKNENTAWNVVIDKDIRYEDEYANLKEVPKMIIYANNIDIDCKVKRIDAVLIAENEIDTCYNSTGVNSQDNSNQLVINGVVVANRLNANRTYGAAAGSNSIVPAEIINYDTTLYLWGSKKADVTETGKLDTAYRRELAPRR